MYQVHRVTSLREELALKNCMASAFGRGGPSERVGFIRKYCGPEYLIIADAPDCRAASGLSAAPAPVYIDGVPVPQASIGYVATRSRYRKLGMCAACLKECHRLFLERDVHLSCLWPFEYFFYRKYGWEIGGSVLECSAGPEAFADCEAAPLFHDSREAPEAIPALYGRCFSRYNGPNVRNRFWWLNYPGLFSSEGLKGAYIKDADGAPAAGCIYSSGEKDGEHILNIPELYYTRRADAEHLLGALRKEYPGARFELKLPTDTDLFDNMPNPRLTRRTVASGHMLRVHDPRKALAFLKPRNSGVLSFSITDPFEDRPHRFTVSWDGPSPEIRAYTGQNPVETTMSGFSRLYSGSVKLTRQNAGDLVSCSEEAADLLADLMPRNGAYRSFMDPG